MTEIRKYKNAMDIKFTLQYMCKRYIKAQTRHAIRKIDCLDLLKVYFIHKKKTPALPRYTEDEEREDCCALGSPTGTEISLE